MKIKVTILVLLMLLGGGYFYIQGEAAETANTPKENNISQNVESESLPESSKQVDSVSSATSKNDTSSDNNVSNINENQTLNATRRYFNSVVNADIEEFLSAFSDSGKLTVVSRTFDSPEELRRFAENEVFGGVYEIFRAEESETGIRILLQFTPKNWTSPEPMAVYNFTIVNDEITTANLQYATDEDKAYFMDKTLEKTQLIPMGFATYLKAVDTDDSNLFITGFTSDGQVLDVSRLIDGPSEIKRWAEREVLSLLYSVGRIRYTDKGAEVINHIRFSESSSGFYGSYDMTLENGLIKYADLQYSDVNAFRY